MTFPAMPDPAAERERDEARRHPERETLELATTGAARVLGVEIKTLRKDQREAIAAATEG